MTVMNVLLLPTMSAVVANDRMFTHLPPVVSEFLEGTMSHVSADSGAVNTVYH